MIFDVFLLSCLQMRAIMSILGPQAYLLCRLRLSYAVVMPNTSQQKLDRPQATSQLITSEHTTKPSAAGEVVPGTVLKTDVVQTRGHVGRADWKKIVYLISAVTPWQRCDGTQQYITKTVSVCLSWTKLPLKILNTVTNTYFNMKVKFQLKPSNLPHSSYWCHLPNFCVTLFKFHELLLPFLNIGCHFFIICISDGIDHSGARFTKHLKMILG